MRSSDWSSDVCSSDLELGAFDDLRRLTAGGVGHAEVDALGAHRLHGSVAEEGLRRRQPDELDALLLRVGDLALRAGHVLAVAAVEATHHLCALAHRRAHAIHGGIAAAEDRKSTRLNSMH